MRISLLLAREPFGMIVEKTLTRFWSERHGAPYTVHWQMGRPRQPERCVQDGQSWLVNIYLNAVFVPNAAPEILDPIRKEFTRSTVWWRRPAQRMYVAMAASPRSASWLAQASIEVRPPVPGATHIVIVAGNHKLRLLDRQAGVTYSILKDGFREHFMRSELKIRQQAEACGVPVPPLLEVDAGAGWFSERYISGTPINRLADQEEAQRAAARTTNALHGLIVQTAEREPWASYVERLQTQAVGLVASNRLLSTSQQRAILAQASALAAQITRAGCADDDITTALTHGDFQPANILVDDELVWLIDWEYGGQRQAGYDLLVYDMSSRFPLGLAKRLQTFVESGWSNEVSFPDDWPGLDTGSRSDRGRHAALFLLEELVLHLNENAEPIFTQNGQGLTLVQEEIARWLQMESTA